MSRYSDRLLDRAVNRDTRTMKFTGDLQGFEMLLTFFFLVVLFRILGRYGVIKTSMKYVSSPFASIYLLYIRVQVLILV